MTTIPDLGQAHYTCGGVDLVSGYPHHPNQLITGIKLRQQQTNPKNKTEFFQI